jgi:[glutamine synthetase] adenylyltransferase / [glutamine synthetase]-adenylyl-L-tyrosine phosphorylase
LQLSHEQRKQAVQSLCPEVDRRVVEDFLARMDDDYFSIFPPEEIAKHVRMSSAIDHQHPVRLEVTPLGAQAEAEFAIAIVGLDYPSEFSIFCGLLSAFGLDIRAGDIYSFARRAPHPAPRKVVDVFSVAVKSGERFDEARQREFEEELHTLTRLLATGATDQARERLNRFLIERLERMNEPLSGLLSPLQIQFDNQISSEWTVMSVQSEDTFGFLYAVSNALSMRGVYIHRVTIRSAGRQATDQFFISDLWGRKIETGPELERLRVAVTLIKEFTRFLPDAPDPAKAIRHFDQFLDKAWSEHFPNHVMGFLAGREGMNILAHLLGSSDFLWEEFLGTHFLDLLPVLENLRVMQSPQGALNKDAFRRELRSDLNKARTFEEQKGALNQFKDRQVFLIDVHHLLDPHVSLMDFSRALTDLAEVVLDEAVRICDARLARAHGPFTICGLGKFGGGEMGYASDLELLFVHDGPGETSFFETLARCVIELIETRTKGIFQIDLRLRPYGDAGAWSIPFDQFRSYYSVNGEAAAFERQALTKLRWVAGDEQLGRRAEAHRDSFTFSGAPWDSENALHLRQRQMRELVKPGRTNVKYSAGGIIDIEYAVQYLQILHGKDHTEVRTPNTLDALGQLRLLKVVAESDYELWRSAYLFLRKLIDALRIVRGDASDLVLPEETSDDFKSLARRLGYRDGDRTKAAATLAADIQRVMQEAHAQFLSTAGKTFSAPEPMP